MHGIRFEIATAADVSDLARLLADDDLGATREVADADAGYTEAFAAVDADPNNEVVVAREDGVVIGMLQLTYTPTLTQRGILRGTIEGVRVSSSHRSQGVGTQMMQWAIERCRTRGCGLVQLTSDLRRDRAIAFYESLGFEHTHAGMKLRIEGSDR